MGWRRWALLLTTEIEKKLLVRSVSQHRRDGLPLPPPTFPKSWLGSKYWAGANRETLEIAYGMAAVVNKSR